MLNYNRFLTQSDLVDFLEEIHENEYEENFPHRDLWAKPDAMLKWMRWMTPYRRSWALMFASGVGWHLLDRIRSFFSQRQRLQTRMARARATAAALEGEPPR